jgi:hypothetical protein
MQLKLDADRGRQTRRRRSGPGRRCRASGGVAPTRTPGRGGLVLGQPQPQPRDGLDVPEFPRRWLPAARGATQPSGGPGWSASPTPPKRPTRRRSMKPLFVEAGRVRGRSGAPPGQAGPEGSRPAHSRSGYYCAIRQTPVTPDPVTDTRHPTPTTDGPGVTTLTAPTSSQAPTTTVPTDVSTSPDQSGDYDSGQGSSGETATTLLQPRALSGSLVPPTVALTQHSLPTLRVASRPRWRSAPLGRASAPLA